MNRDLVCLREVWFGNNGREPWISYGWPLKRGRPEWNAWLMYERDSDYYISSLPWWDRKRCVKSVKKTNRASHWMSFSKNRSFKRVFFSPPISNLFFSRWRKIFCETRSWHLPTPLGPSLHPLWNKNRKRHQLRLLPCELWPLFIWGSAASVFCPPATCTLFHVLVTCYLMFTCSPCMWSCTPPACLFSLTPRATPRAYNQK